MIPAAFIQGWSTTAPWPDPRQVEQDLIMCRALCDLFNAPALKGRTAFRGGTAINKLLFKQPLRYSEDIDLVQIQAEPIGATVDIAPLLPAGVRFDDGDAVRAFEHVWKALITRIKGDAWKLTGKALDELQAGKYPGLLNDCR